ncbi:MAG: MBL fold metallo-hydrolase [Mucilaginibacter sp.]|uniref:MBL fold metallo-hydrolase n=1 Tax=Mucilaginibacter sp. TaxID=1882438 RepID=UPI003267D7A1
MKISFHGAARTVTGSKHLITLNNGEQILLDCGMFQGMGSETEEMNDYFGFNPKKVNYMVLSHAHIDHSGLIPRLVAEGYKGPIFCTAPTIELTKILLTDSSKIITQDAEYTNKQNKKHGRPLIEPMYTEEDVVKAISLFKIVDLDIDFEISPRITLRLTDSGHIIGAAAIHLSILEDAKLTKITFSGDIGRYNDLLLKSPKVFPQADYILLESTYGNSLHSELEPVEEKLYEVIYQTCILRGGKVIIPAFSVGRTQEILYALNYLEEKNKLPDVAYYVDSPLSEKATEILKDHTDLLNKDVQQVMKHDDDVFKFKNLKFVHTTEESIALNDDPRPCVIISSSGMAEAGRVRHHIRNNIGNAKNTILMVGYAEPRSLAGQLKNGNKTVWIFREEHLVKADVQSIDSMSAHGDYNDLIHFLNCQKQEEVKQIFLVHGEYNIQQAFEARLHDKGFKNVCIPDLHTHVDL